MSKFLVSVLVLLSLAYCGEPAYASNDMKCWTHGSTVKCRLPGEYRYQELDIYLNKTEITPFVYTEKDFLVEPRRVPEKQVTYRNVGVSIKCISYNLKRYCEIRGSHKYTSILVTTYNVKVRLYR